MAKIVTLGEIMLRLSPQGNDRFIQSESFRIIPGGGEANVAISLANYGHEAFFEGDRDFGELCGSHPGCQVPFRPPIPNVGLLLRRSSGKGLHLAMTGEPRGFSRVTVGFSSYDGEFRLPLVLAQASPIFHSSCEGKLGIALE